MTLDEAIRQGWGLLEIDQPGLIDTGGIAMKIIVMGPQTKIYFVPQPEAINSGPFKKKLMAQVKEDMKGMAADAVFIVSEAWISTASSRDAKTAARIQELGLPRAHALGLCRKTEALICKVQVRHSIEDVILQWHYERDINDKITMGERDVFRGSGTGRMSGFFNEPEAHALSKIGNAVFLFLSPLTASAGRRLGDHAERRGNSERRRKVYSETIKSKKPDASLAFAGSRIFDCHHRTDTSATQVVLTAPVGWTLAGLNKLYKMAIIAIITGIAIMATVIWLEPKQLHPYDHDRVRHDPHDKGKSASENGTGSISIEGTETHRSGQRRIL